MTSIKKTIGRAPRWPLTHERSYASALRSFIAALDAATREELATNGRDILAAGRGQDIPSQRQDEVTFGDLFTLINNLLQRIVGRVLNPLRGLEAGLKNRGYAVSEFNKRDWRKIVVKAYGVDVVRGNESWLPDLLRGWEAENLALIRSIPEQYVARLRGEFTRAVTEGRSLREMMKVVRDTSGVGRARAELIARDQIGKLNGQMQERRQRDLGVKSFIWKTVGDERVRPTHRARNGKEFRYDRPGPRPGAEIRCRCSASPVLPGLTAADIRDIG